MSLSTILYKTGITATGGSSYADEDLEAGEPMVSGHSLMNINAALVAAATRYDRRGVSVELPPATGQPTRWSSATGAGNAGDAATRMSPSDRPTSAQEITTGLHRCGAGFGGLRPETAATMSGCSIDIFSDMTSTDNLITCLTHIDKWLSESLIKKCPFGSFLSAAGGDNVATMEETMTHNTGGSGAGGTGNGGLQ